jgi:type II restriction/modification system DNA methylase subunit YeeA
MTLTDSLAHRIETCNIAVSRMKATEERINEILLRTYGLEAHLTSEVPVEHVTLHKPTRKSENQRLLSYAIGCTMGHYRLDRPGLIYAQGGNVGFDPAQYTTLPADPDGIVPVIEIDWFANDAAHRFIEFVGVAWPTNHLEENLKFVANSLGPNSAEQPRDAIRRYLATGFYRHHLSMHKKRPIYWLFSSGKHRAFQCLVYLHRYHEGTLAPMRTRYVIPLMGKMAARLEYLQGPPDQKGQGGEIVAASSATLRRKLEKERDTVKKQIAELEEFDAQLRHYADQRTALDLDDGVKVNYGKFSDSDYGDILAEVKAITGGKEEE